MVKYSDVFVSVLSSNQELSRLARSDARRIGVYESARIPVFERVLNRGSGAGGFVLFEGGEVSWRLRSKSSIRAPRSVSVWFIQNSKRVNKVVALKDTSHVYSPIVSGPLGFVVGPTGITGACRDINTAVVLATDRPWGVVVKDSTEAARSISCISKF